MSEAFDIERARQETAGELEHVHLNNAGAALMTEVVVDTVVGHLRREARLGGYEAAESQAAAVETVRESLAALLGAQSTEIAVLDNASHAYDMAVYGLELRRGDRLLVSPGEYISSVLALTHIARRVGACVETIPADPNGVVIPEDLDAVMDHRVRLVSVAHVATNSGDVNDVVAVGQVAASHPTAVYIVDACQSVGQLAIQVDRIGCDLLVGTGRKFLRGPRGTGFLYASARMSAELQPAFADVAGARLGTEGCEFDPTARRFESWETSVANRLGLGAAASYLTGWGIETLSRRALELAEQLRAALANVPRVLLFERSESRSAIVTFCIEGANAVEVKRALWKRGVNVSVANAGDSPRLPLQDRPALWLRASPHYFNTEAEIEYASHAMEEIAARAA